MTDSPNDPAIDLRFVVDDWSTMAWPPFLRSFGFSHRFEVIQDTFVEGAADMHVDRPLWLRLADYVALEGKHHRVVVVADLSKAGLLQQRVPAFLQKLFPGAADRALARIERHGVPLDAFLVKDTPRGDGDWDAPDAVFVLDGRTVRLAMTTERYYSVGGESAVHHDSATYAFHARRDMSGACIAFLQLSPQAARWNFEMLVSLADPPG